MHRFIRILPGSVLAAKDDPGVPYTYAAYVYITRISFGCKRRSGRTLYVHSYVYITVPGSVLAAKGDPGVPYAYIHTYILPRISFGCKKLSGRTL